MVASCCCWFDGSPVTLIYGLFTLICWLHLFFHILDPTRFLFILFIYLFFLIYGFVFLFKTYLDLNSYDF